MYSEFVPPKRVSSQQLETRRKGSDFRQPPVEKGPFSQLIKILVKKNERKNKYIKRLKTNISPCRTKHNETTKHYDRDIYVLRTTVLNANHMGLTPSLELRVMGTHQTRRKGSGRSRSVENGLILEKIYPYERVGTETYGRHTPITLIRVTHRELFGLQFEQYHLFLSKNRKKMTFMATLCKNADITK